MSRRRCCCIGCYCFPQNLGDVLGKYIAQMGELEKKTVKCRIDSRHLLNAYTPHHFHNACILLHQCRSTFSLCALHCAVPCNERCCQAASARSQLHVVLSVIRLVTRLPGHEARGRGYASGLSYSALDMPNTRCLYALPALLFDALMVQLGKYQSL